MAILDRDELHHPQFPRRRWRGVVEFFGILATLSAWLVGLIILAALAA